VPELLYHLPSK